MRTDYADEKHRGWMRDLLQRAAAHFGLVLIGEPTFGWNDRSIGTAAEGPAGTRWLRVVTEHLTWTDNDFWTGNADSAVIPGVAKPLLLDFVEYDERGQRIRAEVMTLASGQVCSPTQDLRDELALPPTWWAELRRSLGLLATVPTRRVAVGQREVERRLAVFWGDRVDPTVRRWTTAHGDLHWGNLMQPELAILDWEHWGAAPVGYDAALLYCYSLRSRETAARVRQTFADLLDTPDGMLAELYAIARLLLRIERGDHPTLTIPLHRRASQLVTA